MSKRVLFYSHDTVGLGHIRRTLAIAKHLSSASREVTGLILAGSPFLSMLRLPRNVDYVKLPSLRKVDNTHYEARNLRVERRDLFDLREELIRKTFERFRPHLFIVDKVPAGVQRELLPTLEENRRRGGKARIVLGLRDILDSPEEVIRAWTREGTYDVIDRYYDKVMIWGMKKIYDPVREYAFPPAVAQKVTFCGYIDRKNRSAGAPLPLQRMGRRIVLATAGGGEDGLLLLQTFVQSLAHTRERFASIVLLGPDMSEGHRARIRAHLGPGRENVFILDYTNNMERFIRAASVVVSMSGYNSVCETVANRRKPILVPRIFPRREQLIRATHMEDLGLARMIHPADLTPENLAGEIEQSLRSSAPPPVDRIDFGGLERAYHEFSSILRPTDARMRDEGLWEGAAS